jgi:hypothetical protein
VSRKFKSVLAFGDSHVAGCELSLKVRYSFEDYSSGKITIEEADSIGKEYAFPKIVADELNVPCYNYAMTGGSNDRSIRCLIKAVQEHPNSLVLFGYTAADRKEFFYPDEGHFLGRDKDNFIQVGLQWEGKVKGAMYHPINDLFIHKIMRPYNNLSDLMFLVDNLCAGWASDFFHIPLFPEVIPNVNNLLDFEGHTNYIDWCKFRGFKQMPFLHYDQEAHTELAKLILKEIQ